MHANTKDDTNPDNSRINFNWYMLVRKQLLSWKWSQIMALSSSYSIRFTQSGAIYELQYPLLSTYSHVIVQCEKSHALFNPCCAT